MATPTPLKDSGYLLLCPSVPPRALQVGKTNFMRLSPFPGVPASDAYCLLVCKLDVIGDGGVMDVVKRLANGWESDLISEANKSRWVLSRSQELSQRRLGQSLGGPTGLLPAICRGGSCGKRRVN